MTDALSGCSHGGGEGADRSGEETEGLLNSYNMSL